MKCNAFEIWRVVRVLWAAFGIYLSMCVCVCVLVCRCVCSCMCEHAQQRVCERVCKCSMSLFYQDSIFHLNVVAGERKTSPSMACFYTRTEVPQTDCVHTSTQLCKHSSQLPRGFLGPRSDAKTTRHTATRWTRPINTDTVILTISMRHST